MPTGSGSGYTGRICRENRILSYQRSIPVFLFMAASGIDIIAKKVGIYPKAMSNSGWKNLTRTKSGMKKTKRPCKDWAGKSWLSGNARLRNIQ